MTSKSISITSKVYQRLDQYRLKNESFSQAITRLLDSNADIIKLAGAWKKISDIDPALDVIEKTVKKIHEESRTTVEAI